MRRAFVVVLAAATLGGSVPARGQFPITTAAATQDQIALASSDSSVVIVWRDNREDPGDPYDIYASRLNYDLNPLWSPLLDGANKCSAAGAQTEPAVTMGPDGTTWLSWRDYRTCSGGEVYVLGLAPDGLPTCQVNGNKAITATECSHNMRNHSVISVAAGAGLVAWHRFVDEGLGCHHDELRVQKLTTAACALQWGTAGVLVHNHGRRCDAFGVLTPSLVSDGAGGIIIVWFYANTSNTERLYARRLDSAGNLVWASTVRVCGTEIPQRNPSVAPDGSGGVIVVWEQGAIGTRTILAQRLDASGVAQWGACGKVIAGSGGDLRNPQIARSTAGRSFIVWQADYGPSNSDIFAQRINFLGDTLAARIPVCTALYGQTVPRVAARPDGSCYVVWEDGRDLAIGDNADIFSQRLDASGAMLCQSDGVRLAPHPDNADETVSQYAPRIVSVAEMGGSPEVPGGHEFVAWNDTGNGFPDIYGIALADDCQGVVAVEAPASMDLLGPAATYPNPFSRASTIQFQLPQSATVTLRVFDISGRLIRVLADSEPMDAGQHEIQWDGSTDAGAKVTPGVYFYRLATGSRAQSYRMVFLK